MAFGGGYSREQLAGSSPEQDDSDEAQVEDDSDFPLPGEGLENSREDKGEDLQEQQEQPASDVSIPDPESLREEPESLKQARKKYLQALRIRGSILRGGYAQKLVTSWMPGVERRSVTLEGEELFFGEENGAENLRRLRQNYNKKLAEFRDEKITDFVSQNLQSVPEDQRDQAITEFAQNLLAAQQENQNDAYEVLDEEFDDASFRDWWRQDEVRYGRHVFAGLSITGSLAGSAVTGGTAWLAGRTAVGAAGAYAGGEAYLEQTDNSLFASISRRGAVSDIASQLEDGSTDDQIRQAIRDQFGLEDSESGSEEYENLREELNRMRMLANELGTSVEEAAVGSDELAADVISQMQEMERSYVAENAVAAATETEEEDAGSFEDETVVNGLMDELAANDEFVASRMEEAGDKERWQKMKRKLGGAMAGAGFGWFIGSGSASEVIGWTADKAEGGYQWLANFFGDDPEAAKEALEPFMESSEDVDTERIDPDILEKFGADQEVDFDEDISSEELSGEQGDNSQKTMYPGAAAESKTASGAHFEPGEAPEVTEKNGPDWLENISQGAGKQNVLEVEISDWEAGSVADNTDKARSFIEATSDIQKQLDGVDLSGHPQLQQLHDLFQGDTANNLAEQLGGYNPEDIKESLILHPDDSLVVTNDGDLMLNRADDGVDIIFDGQAGEVRTDAFADDSFGDYDDVSGSGTGEDAAGAAEPTNEGQQPTQETPSEPAIGDESVPDAQKVDPIRDLGLTEEQITDLQVVGVETPEEIIRTNADAVGGILEGSSQSYLKAAGDVPFADYIELPDGMSEGAFRRNLRAADFGEPTATLPDMAQTHPDRFAAVQALFDGYYDYITDPQVDGSIHSNAQLKQLYTSIESYLDEQAHEISPETQTEATTEPAIEITTDEAAIEAQPETPTEETDTPGDQPPPPPESGGEVSMSLNQAVEQADVTDKLQREIATILRHQQAFESDTYGNIPVEHLHELQDYLYSPENSNKNLLAVIDGMEDPNMRQALDTVLYDLSNSQDTPISPEITETLDAYVSGDATADTEVVVDSTSVGGEAGEQNVSVTGQEQSHTESPTTTNQESSGTAGEEAEPVQESAGTTDGTSQEPEAEEQPAPTDDQAASETSPEAIQDTLTTSAVAENAASDVPSEYPLQLAQVLDTAAEINPDLYDDLYNATVDGQPLVTQEQLHSLAEYVGKQGENPDLKQLVANMLDEETMNKIAAGEPNKLRTLAVLTDYHGHVLEDGRDINISLDGMTKEKIGKFHKYVEEAIEKAGGSADINTPWLDPWSE